MDAIERNTVSGQGQLRNSKGYVTFINPEGKGKRIMMVGNSITRHGVLPEIGWHWNWGMAASDISKDYVHVLADAISGVEEDPAFCIAQVAEWECKYKNGEEVYEFYEMARAFNADVIILRLIENCPRKEFEPELFKEQLGKLCAFLDGKGDAKFIIATSFWKHVGDPMLLEYAKENNIPSIYMGDMGEDESYMAIGLFEHEGVASHPGDKGMAEIARRIFEVYKTL